MKRERVWETAYRQVIKLENMSHQHLSNITYYNRLVVGVEIPSMITEELNNRFGGIILPYQPLINFKFEMDALVNKGYTSGEPDADIIVDGKWIGKVKYT